MGASGSVKRLRQAVLAWPGRDRARDEAEDDGSEPEARFATDDGRGRFWVGDNLASLRRLHESSGAHVALAYMDPPFLTNRVHEAVGGTAGDGSVRRGAKRLRKAAFDDRWDDQASYLEALAPRMEAIRDLLAPHGSLVVHVDPKTSHYVRVLGDEIFGPECFASEIIWRYRRWPSKTPNYQRVHDVLLRFRKDPDVAPRWTQAYEPLAASTLATWGTRKQRAVFDGKDRLRSSSTEEESKGVPLGDVWDIGVLAPVSKERTGYPSQKPLALLDRLVTTLTLPGDTVLDPYAGSGTTLVSAHALGRNFVGFDASPVAVETVRRRFDERGVTLREERAPALPGRRKRVV
ncbi:MAG: site-specific DNA-methyltransferase [Polyangiaceae bacterium]